MASAFLESQNIVVETVESQESDLEALHMLFTSSSRSNGGQSSEGRAKVYL